MILALFYNEQIDVKDLTFIITESCVPAQVVAAVDVNTVANEVYKYNFPHTRLLARTIEVSNSYYCFNKYIASKNVIEEYCKITDFWCLHLTISHI